MEDVTALVPVAPEALSVSRAPEIVLEEARKAATALKQVIDSKKRKVVFNGETYLENEDWLTVARFYGVTSRISSTKYVEFGDPGDEFHSRGYEATAEAFLVQTGQIISTAESMCLSDEPNWRKKPLFQLKSMAQTRASSRVLRQVFGWVVVLAGYKPTSAEEMGGVDADVAVAICSECGEDIWQKSEVYESRKKFAKTLCKICQKHAKLLPADIQNGQEQLADELGVKVPFNKKKGTEQFLKEPAIK